MSQIEHNQYEVKAVEICKGHYEVMHVDIEDDDGEEGATIVIVLEENPTIYVADDMTLSMLTLKQRFKKL